ncbi:uncharacterized protein DS421_16g552410 [Arachis hypogaea]|nr:uncharacterized protein DS421_16g552410 [Arachis hypogaea]
MGEREREEDKEKGGAERGMTTALIMQQVWRASTVKKEKKTTSLAANPPLRKTSGRLVGKNKLNFNYSSRQVKIRLEPIAVSISSNTDDKDDTSNASDGNLDGPVVSQENEEENESNSSSDKAVTAAPTIFLIVSSIENLMAATSNQPTPNANADKLQNSEIPQSEWSKKQIPITSIHTQTPNVVNDLLAKLGSLNEAYACSMDTQKAIVASCSTIQTHLPTEQLHTTCPTTKTGDKSILLPLAQQLSVVLSKPVLTLSTDLNFKAQLSDILQTFLITPHHVTIDPLLARLRKLKQDTSSFETAKTTLAAHIAKAKDQAHELSAEIRDLEQQLTVKREVKNRLDAALIKNEGQFDKASSMLDNSNASL